MVWAEPGSYLYSNLGSGVLGWALAGADEGARVPTLEKDVADWLGLRETGFEREPGAQGHDADGNPTPRWRAGQSILSGAFGLVSTPRDLVQFCKVHLAALKGGEQLQSQCLRLAMKPKVRMGPNEAGCLGWRVNRGGVFLTSGRTGGFATSILLHPASGFAVVLIANSQVGGATDLRAMQFDLLAAACLHRLLGIPLPVIDLPSPWHGMPMPAQEFEGVFCSEVPGAPRVRIRSGKEGLEVLAPGGLFRRMIPMAKDVFFLRAHQATLEFLRDGKGGVQALNLNMGGQSFVLNRKL